MKKAYLIAAIVGAVVPFIFFLQFFSEMGADLGTFVAGLFANGAAGGFAADLLITSTVFWAYMFARSEGPRPWPYVAVNLLIGLSCALPLYLYMSYKEHETLVKGKVES
jgi:Protein of unknown function DUF2834